MALLDLLLFIVPWIHVLISPYTKVEESFNLHATHDVLMYGVQPDNLPNYDHFVFPGAVPRSFIGSVLLAWASTPILYLAGLAGVLHSKVDIQIALRLVLATVNSAGLVSMRRATTARFGRASGAMFVLLTCTQFHLPYWIGRTLPNMFALLPVNFALSTLVKPAAQGLVAMKRLYVAVFLLTMTAVIFRGEVALLLVPIILRALFYRHTTIPEMLMVGLISSFFSLGLTVMVDSYFWKVFPLWPEFSSVYFNIYEGKSSDWGVSPVHTYFSAHIPKLLLCALPLSILGALVDGGARQMLLTPLSYIGMMSFLGHKEWRFVIYTVPLFNVVAARGAGWIFARRRRSIVAGFLALGLLAALGANIAITSVLTMASSKNYPGGYALASLNHRFSHLPSANVYIDNLAAQTGASLFLQNHAPPYPIWLEGETERSWTYDKTENVTDFGAFSHVLTEDASRFSEGVWEVADVIRGFTGHIKLPGTVGDVKNLVPTGEKLWILSRR